MTLEDLIALGRNRWIVALLADLSAHDGARFVELAHRLNLARDSLTRTLQTAKDAGWVMPNPGYGHPLRPEYILTKEGKRLAQAAFSISSAQDRIHLSPNELTRWSLPIIKVIDDGERRFNAIARLLPQATPRALSLGLRGLAEVKLVRRELIEGYPPVTQYLLTNTGKEIARAA